MTTTTMEKDPGADCAALLILVLFVFIMGAAGWYAFHSVAGSDGTLIEHKAVVLPVQLPEPGKPVATPQTQ